MKEPGKSPPPLVIIGMGDDGLDGLPLTAVRELFSADVLFTSRRLERMLPEEVQVRTHVWPSPFDLLPERIAQEREAGRQVAVLTSGNPFWHGAGALLAEHFPSSEMIVHPAPSAFSLASARMGWAMQHVRKISLHGRRPPALVETAIHPGARMLILANDGGTPLAVAERLAHRGYGRSRLVILAHMNGSRESRHELVAAELVESGRTDFPALHVLAVECVPDDAAEAVILPPVPGLPDSVFVHDGQITKQSVRAITVSALRPYPGAVLWDVGAGCGSISVEWLRIAGPRSRAWAVERSLERCHMMADNADRLGAWGLEIVNGTAPGALTSLPAPDAIFMGTSARDEKTFLACLDALRPGGILVVNAVTAGGEAALMQRHERLGGELIRISISHAAPLGGEKAMRPALPVLQYRLVKKR